MNQPVLIKQVRVLDPEGIWDRLMNVWIKNGRIESISELAIAVEPGTQVIEAKGHWLLPGLVDLGYRITSLGSVQQELIAAAAAGFSDWIVLPGTEPVNDTPAVTHMLKGLEPVDGIRIWPLAAMTQALAGHQLSEMARLKQAGCIGVSQGHGSAIHLNTLLNSYRYANTFSLPVVSLPEETVFYQMGAVHDGALGCAMGLPVLPSCAETLAVARDIELIEAAGGQLHFANISTAGSVRLIAAAQQRGLPVSCGVSLNQLLYTDKAIAGFNPLFHLRPPVRSEADRQALLLGIADGVIQHLNTDHSPHPLAAKAAPFTETASGMATLDSYIPRLLVLLAQEDLPLKAVVSALTCQPRAILNLPTLGLQVGDQANCALVDPDISWQLNAASAKSLGSNTPDWGQSLVGKVMLTFIDGALAYADSAI